MKTINLGSSLVNFLGLAGKHNGKLVSASQPDVKIGSVVNVLFSVYFFDNENEEIFEVDPFDFSLKKCNKSFTSFNKTKKNIKEKIREAFSSGVVTEYDLKDISCITFNGLQNGFYGARILITDNKDTNKLSTKVKLTKKPEKT
jgi:hypothetical protein